jgi:hypothetical protein
MRAPDSAGLFMRLCTGIGGGAGSQGAWATAAAGCDLALSCKKSLLFEGARIENLHDFH